MFYLTSKDAPEIKYPNAIKFMCAVYIQFVYRILSNVAIFCITA